MKAPRYSETSGSSNKASHPRRSESSSATPLWEPHITHKQNLFISTWNGEQNTSFPDTLFTLSQLLLIRITLRRLTSFFLVFFNLFSRAGWLVLPKIFNGRVGWILNALPMIKTFGDKTDERKKSGIGSSIKCGLLLWTLGTCICVCARACVCVRVCASL